MTKRTRYPRKLRQTLEKIATARDQREAAAESGPTLDPFNTFYRAFLPANSVHALVAGIDAVLERVTATAHIRPGPYAERISGAAPWDVTSGSS